MTRCLPGLNSYSSERAHRSCCHRHGVTTPQAFLGAKRYGIPFIDVIPDLPHQPRRKEISQWLLEHPEVIRYIVIDDEDDDLDGLPLFQPSSRTGLTEEIVAGAADYLNEKTEKDMRSSRFVRALQNLHAIFRGHPG
jgi:hypothetical protein